MLSGGMAPEPAWKGLLPAGSALLEMHAHSYWAGKGAERGMSAERKQTVQNIF